ncbi:MAG: magnesium-translocating P-type ATPase [Patescibacteria group bacterium]
MNYSSYTLKNKEEIAREFSTSLDNGLFSSESEIRLKKFGPNELKGKETTPWLILKRQFSSPFIYLLIGAAILAFALKEIIDGGMIIVFVLINAFLGFYQEYRSEHALKMLSRFVSPQARVRRNGAEKMIPTKDLVPGDLVIVEPGDILPADLRFVKEYDLTIDESVLTGESISVKKIGESLKKEAKEIFESKNLGFSGTTVVSGKGEGIILATGKKTEIGRIAKMTAETEHTGTFEKSLGKFSKFILRLISLTLIFVFAANIFIKGFQNNIIELIIFTIALAISVIPEALPVVVTFSLSRGALRLAKNKVVVKRLAAIEDLGSIEVLCTDKTGTITENVLTVAGQLALGKEPLMKYACLASPFLKEKKIEANNSFDLALCRRLSDEEKREISAYKIQSEIPFDPERRRNTVVIKNGREPLLISRGATENILGLCPKINPAEKEKISRWLTEEGEKGRRIIAVAYKKITGKKPDIEKEENNLHLVGLISFTDPLKKSSKDAIERAEKLGVKIKILTGDSKEVSLAVAKEIGLADEKHGVITGEEFESLSLEKQGEAAREHAVFARVSPAQKFLIIEVLKQKYEVGFLGEGINDAPALKIANVGLAVDKASDIARETADIVLLNKSLSVIIDGIAEGRQVFANTLKYIKATLTSNFGNFFAVAIASLLIDYLPMLPLQILLLNLLSDFPMIAIAADNVDLEELKRPKHYQVRDIALMAITLGVISTIFDFIFFALFYRISPGVLQTNWFIASVFTELVLIFSIRTRKPFWRARKPAAILLWLSLAAIAINLIIPFTGFGRELFQFVKPSPGHLLTIGFVVLLYFICTESGKLLYYRFVKNNEDK